MGRKVFNWHQENGWKNVEKEEMLGLSAPSNWVAPGYK